MLLDTIACRKIGDRKYILGNVAYQCEGDDYISYSLKTIIPILVFFSFFVPFAVLFTLYGVLNKTNIDKKEQKENKI